MLKLRFYQGGLCGYLSAICYISSMDKEAIRLRMEAALGIFRKDIAAIRTGRANPGLIENIEVSVYNGQQKMALKQLGSITVPEARLLVFQPWDVSIIQEIKNGLQEANLGFSVAVDNNLIRLSLPPLSTEQRQEYARLLGQKTEAARVRIRDIRGEYRYELQDEKRRGDLSEDDFRQQGEELQQLTDEFIAKIDELAAEKEKEILAND